MQITAAEFVKSPALYLKKIDDGAVDITQDGLIIAVLSKPSTTPITDSLLGILKDSGVKSTDDIKAMRLGV